MTRNKPEKPAGPSQGFRTPSGGLERRDGSGGLAEKPAGPPQGFRTPSGGLERSDSSGGPLDPLLHQPLRTQIAAYLAGVGAATFSDLKRLLDVSDGNLDAHLKKLLAAGYVQASKSSEGPRPQTTYALTATGREALQAYVTALQGLIAFAQAEDDHPDPASGAGVASSAWRSA